MSSILGVIPARYRSSRFPGKPLALIQGEPMIAHVHRAATRSRLLNGVIVATEDERIMEACRELGIESMMTSPAHPTGTDRVAEVAAATDADIYVNIQGDEPMLDPNTIDAAISPLLDTDQREVQVTNLVAEITSPQELIDTNTIKVVTTSDLWGVYLSRQAIPYPRDRQGLRHFKQVCVYGFRKPALLRFPEWGQAPLERAEGIELLRFLENRVPVKFVEVVGGSVAVDTPEDLVRVNALLAEANAP